MKKKIPRVAVFLPSTLSGVRNIILGLHRYTQNHRPWQFFFLEGRFGERQLVNLKAWQCDAIITYSCDRAMAQRFRSLNVPIFVIQPSPEITDDPDHPLHNCSYYRLDSHTVGRVAAEHLLGKGFTNFAFVGDAQDMYWSHERGDAFERTVGAKGYVTRCYQWHRHAKDWGGEVQTMIAWIRKLPKPVAIFASMDGCARLVLDACLMGNITVPNEVAVLGCDNDELICSSTIPPLSSIKIQSQSFYSGVASFIDRLIDNPDLPQRVFVNKPSSVITRQSTDIKAVNSPAVIRAMEFIERNAHSPRLNVGQVVAEMRMSRRMAEIAFKSALGRTILDEITAYRLKIVIELLTDTTLSIAEITGRAGYSRQSYLARLFLRRHGVTMTEYRKRFSQ